MIGLLKKACEIAQKKKILYNLRDSELYSTKEEMVRYYPSSVSFFPEEVIQNTYKNNAKFPLKKASIEGFLVMVEKTSRNTCSKYAFPIERVEELIDEISNEEC